MPDQRLRQNQNANIGYCVEHCRTDTGLKCGAALRRDTPIATEWATFKEGNEPASDPPEDGPGGPEVNANFEPLPVESENASEKREDRQFSEGHSPIVEDRESQLCL